MKELFFLIFLFSTGTIFSRILNAGFEEGLTNWTSVKITSSINSSILYEGVQSLDCSFNSTSNADTEGNFEYSEITEAEYNPPLTYGLRQKFPNPFNPSTKISFAVPRTSFISIKVYSVLGNQAAVLFNGKAQAGKTYDLLFDGSDLASGVYYCTPESARNPEIKKMLLLR